MASALGKWADGPLELIETPSFTKRTDDHPAHYIANEMAFAHSAMLRGLNAIYLQAPYVPKADVSDFLFFVSSWAGWVQHHHILEETRMFPDFERIPGIKAGQLSHNIEQHHLFSTGLDDLKKYATNTTEADYDGGRLRELITSFSTYMREHLADEIDTLWSLECCEKGQEENLLQVYKDCEAEAGKQDKTVVPPMVLGLCDKTFQGGNSWPAMPIGSEYIVHYLLGRKHRGAWRFLPSDTFRRPRPLPFLGDES
ncbi:hemerythrin HHE cation binding domain protein [Trichoderma guizhouense]|uniref:Hemerythrin HHE cation binding domain protein n=1 Tax=Trichoderma guizhouense TaxID=1491466 RepID=A0A1T3CRR9_9HYPO|nr:hemerythrin HHE cation binding domain protein [Trichoderma guizhouense]